MTDSVTVITVACLDISEVRRVQKELDVIEGAHVEAIHFSNPDQTRGHLRDILIIPREGIPEEILIQLKMRTRLMTIELYNR